MGAPAGLAGNRNRKSSFGRPAGLADSLAICRGRGWQLCWKYFGRSAWRCGFSGRAQEHKCLAVSGQDANLSNPHVRMPRRHSPACSPVSTAIIPTTLPELQLLDSTRIMIERPSLSEWDCPPGRFMSWQGRHRVQSEFSELAPLSLSGLEHQVVGQLQRL